MSAKRVHIREVGPRDGFQNEPEVIPTEVKVELIDQLSRTGLERLEVTSFVRPDVIPQLSDAREVLQAIDTPEGVALTVLIPNERGLDNALELRDRFHEINVFLSASETHNRKNVNRSIEESLAGLERVLPRAREAGLRCEGVIAVSFGCPYEGHVPPQRVFDIARRLVAAGAQEVGFGDTTGMANPAQVRSFFADARDALGPDVDLTAHFHNTRGQGLANVYAAWEAGVDSFESSFGELGGCPVPKGATGNVATEDVVSMPRSRCRWRRGRSESGRRRRRSRGRRAAARGRSGAWGGTPPAPGRARRAGGSRRCAGA
jgi:hydroxymethylglutaryl-CoA lyase